MPNLVPIKRALLSVSDKTDLVAFARRLEQHQVEIISTGGTAAALEAAGIPVTHVQDVTGVPEMLDGRVKTLHPAIHGGLLAVRDKEDHQEAMRTHGIEPIDLVCISLYPFEQTIQKTDITEAEAIEQIDIGGPAMIRSAAKNHAYVAVVTNVDQYDTVVDELSRNEGCTTAALRRDLAAAAFTRTAEYDTAISAWMSARQEAEFPPLLRLTYHKQDDLRYGENPHQRGVLYADPSAGAFGLPAARQLHGKQLSYNNLNDADAALSLARELHLAMPGQAAAVVVKHTNPCGAATAESLADAFDRAYEGDPVAAYGGILALSETVDQATANRIADGQRFFEVIVAPGFNDDAIGILTDRWKNVRLLALPKMQDPAPDALSYRSITGGMLVQDCDDRLPDLKSWQRAAGPAIDDDTKLDAAMLWLAVKHLTSNAVAIGADRRLLGAGAGQMDRVNACRIAIEKCGDRIASAGRTPIAVSDAFFPFPDGPELLIEAGVRCIVHPGGSKRDQDTIDLCEEKGVTVILTGVRHFRH